MCVCVCVKHRNTTTQSYIFKQRGIKIIKETMSLKNKTVSTVEEIQMASLIMSSCNGVLNHLQDLNDQKW